MFKNKSEMIKTEIFAFMPGRKIKIVRILNHLLKVLHKHDISHLNNHKSSQETDN